ncbi:hypothetical protein BC828DRAFT_405136 [Blastocladiella britannica]|nr:hypothetical protein BC828DRAFT_405136 [Blastocladiella britannica]
MTRPRRDKREKGRDHEPTKNIGFKQRKDDVPGRFRVIQHFQKQLEDRQAAKAASKLAKRKAGAAPVLPGDPNESLPPEGSKPPAPEEDPALLGSKKGRKKLAAATAAASASDPKPESKVKGKKAAATADVDAAAPETLEAPISASAKRRRRREIADAATGSDDDNDDNDTNDSGHGFDPNAPKPTRPGKRPRLQEFAQLEDKVRFGEVAQAPPQLKVSSKMQKRKMERVMAEEVEKTTMRKTGMAAKSPAERRQLDDERSRMIQLYRDLKAKKELDRSMK